MKKKYREIPLKNRMERNEISNPYEIKESDIGQFIDLAGDFGCALPSDVGRLIYLRNGIIQMESVEQMNKRKGE